MIKKSGKMIKEPKLTKIIFNLYYLLLPGGEIALVKLTLGPKAKNIKWGLIGGSKYYTFNELSNKIFGRHYRKGENPKFYIINEDIDQKAPIGIDISSKWPLSGPPREYVDCKLNISNQMRKIGLI